jgi:mycothiol system anti-sigma-R factor
MTGEKYNTKIKCREVLRGVYDFLDGEMTPERREQISRHLDKCAPCLKAFGFETEIRKLVADRCRDSVPEELRVRIAAVIDSEHKQRQAAGGVADGAEH